jgi:hypothetical protein
MLALGAGSAACSQQKPEPQVASSADQASYAVDYPQDLDAATTNFAARQDDVKAATGRFDGYADQLKDPKSIPVAIEVVDAADASGKSWAYVERSRELEGVSGFFDAEGKDIAGRVAGAANYAGKEKSCDPSVGGAAAGAIKPAVGKSIEKRLRDRNEAFAVIERYKSSLPKADVAVLEKLADDVARASYLAHVELVEHKNRVRRMAGEASSVKKTLDGRIKFEQQWQAEAGRSDADKKASNERIEAANKAKAQVDASVQKANDADQKGAMDQAVKDAQKSYDDALASLEKKLKEKSKAK